jgi:hypothetical protein
MWIKVCKIKPALCVWIHIYANEGNTFFRLLEKRQLFFFRNQNRDRLISVIMRILIIFFIKFGGVFSRQFCGHKEKFQTFFNMLNFMITSVEISEKHSIQNSIKKNMIEKKPCELYQWLVCVHECMLLHIWNFQPRHLSCIFTSVSVNTIDFFFFLNEFLS